MSVVYTRHDIFHTGRLEDYTLLIMYMLALCIFLAAVGVPGNLLLIYVIAVASEKVAAFEIFYMHISVANMLQLITRILTVTIADQSNPCYPMSVQCKLPLFILFCSRKASMWITLMLDFFHLVKLTNRNGFLSSVFLKKSFVQLCLTLNWLIWIAVCVPYPLLVSSDRPRQNRIHNNTTCICSIFAVLTEEDYFLKTYDMVFGTVLQCLAIILMCLVDIKVLWILLKHQQATFSHATSRGQRSHQREVNMIKVITSLVVFFVICHLIDALLRNFSSEFASHFKTVIDHLYPTFTPFILGFGDQRFRKSIKCIMFYRPCQTTSIKEIATVS